MEFAKAAITTPPPVPKPSVKRELLFDPCETPKKAKAPVPTSKRPSISVVIKAEKVAPTAAKSGNSRVENPAAPKTAVPVKQPVGAPPPTLNPPAKTEAAMPKPVATPARAAAKATASERTRDNQQAAATLRRLKPMPSSPVSSPAGTHELTPEEMADRRLANKMGVLTDEEMEQMALENAIFQELAGKSDDEIDAMFKEIKRHPLFKKFAQVQREETGDDEWTFEDTDQIPIWEMWVQKYVKPPPKAKPSSPEHKDVTPEPKQVALPKAGILRIAPPPAKHPAVALPPSPAKASSPVEPKSTPVPKSVTFALPPAVEPKVSPLPPPVPLTARPGGSKEVSGFTIAVKDGSNVTRSAKSLSMESSSKGVNKKKIGLRLLGAPYFPTSPYLAI